MKPTFLGPFAVMFLLLSVGQLLVRAQNASVVHWTNAAGESVVLTLSNSLPFITSFKTSNDVTVTRLIGTPGTVISVGFGTATPGNNPWYLRQFVGSVNEGTGNETNVGQMRLFFPTFGPTGAFHFTFQIPLTPRDRILLTDTDAAEKYTLRGYVLNGTNYQEVSLAGCPTQDYTGRTGVLPVIAWADWNPEFQTLTADPRFLDLNEPAFELTPDRNLDRIVLIKNSGNGSGTGIQFVSLALAPLDIEKIDAGVVIRWPLGFSNLTLYASDNLTASSNWTAAPTLPVPEGSNWAVTNSVTGQQKFYRLQ